MRKGSDEGGGGGVGRPDPGDDAGGAGPGPSEKTCHEPRGDQSRQVLQRQTSSQLVNLCLEFAHGRGKFFR